jgi:hypothetical protein
LTESPLQAQLVRLRLRLTRILQLRVFLQRLQSGLLRQEQIMFSRLRVFQQRVLSGLLALSVMSLLFLLELAVRVKSHKFWSGGRLFRDKTANWQNIDESQNSQTGQNIDDGQTPNWQEVA